MADKTAEQEIFGLGNPEETSETTPSETEVPLEPEDESSDADYKDDEEVSEEESAEEKDGEISEKGSEEEPEKEQESPEEISKKFWQHNYQVAMKRLKEVDPDFQDWMKEVKEERKQKSKHKPEEREVDEKYVSDLTTDELIDMINESVGKASELAYQKVQARANYGHELKVAKQVLEGFASENDIPKNEVEEALKYAYQELGLTDSEPGGPTRVARAVIDRLRFVGMQKLLSEKMNKTTATVAEKLKTANLVKQPNAAAIPANAEKKKSREEMLLESMKSIANNKASKEVYNI